MAMEEAVNTLGSFEIIRPGLQKLIGSEHNYTDSLRGFCGF